MMYSATLIYFLKDILNVNILETVRAIFKDTEICHRMVSLSVLYFVTLINVFKVINWNVNISKTATVF